MPLPENGSSEPPKNVEEPSEGIQRASNYPRRRCAEDEIRSSRDRRDHFSAAELMILGTSGGRKTLEFLQKSKVFGGRLALIKSIKGEEGQLGLEGIIKRLLRNGETITDFTLNRFFEEMKACLYPETTTLPRIAPSSPPPKPPLAPNGVIPQKIARVLERRRREPQPLPVKSRWSSPASHQGDPVDLGTRAGFQQLIEKSLAHQFHRQDRPGTTRSRSLPNRKQPDPVQPDLVSPPPEPVVEINPVTCPKFTSSEAAFCWLRGQNNRWGEVYARLLNESSDPLFDDLRISTILGTQPDLRQIVFELRDQFGYSRLLDFIKALFSSSGTPPISQGVDVSNGSGEVAMERLRKISHGILSLHDSGQYRDFLEACGDLPEDIILALQIIQKTNEHRSLIETIFFIAGKPYPPAERSLYYKHTCQTRLHRLPGVCKTLKEILEHRHFYMGKMPALKGKLEETWVQIPQDIRSSWYGFDELEAPSRTLYDVVVSLIVTGDAYQKGDEGSTKKLMAIIGEIMAQE